MFLRSLHLDNDSRFAPTDKWKKLVNWRSDKRLLKRFPFLGALPEGALGSDLEFEH